MAHLRFVLIFLFLPLLAPTLSAQTDPIPPPRVLGRMKGELSGHFEVTAPGGIRDGGAQTCQVSSDVRFEADQLDYAFSALDCGGGDRFNDRPWRAVRDGQLLKNSAGAILGTVSAVGGATVRFSGAKRHAKVFWVGARCPGGARPVFREIDLPWTLEFQFERLEDGALHMSRSIDYTTVWHVRTGEGCSEDILLDAARYRSAVSGVLRESD